MFRFLLRKIAKKKWMTLALLVGNTLLIGITLSNPVYTQAVLQRMLTRNLSDFMLERNAYPGLVTLRDGANSAAKANSVFETAETAAAVPGMYGIDALSAVSYIHLNASSAQPELVRDDDRMGKSLILGTMSGIEGHIRLTAGRMYSDEPDADGIIEVIVSEGTLINLNLLMNEVIVMPSLKNAEGDPIRIRIIGVFTNSEPDDLYWVRSPRMYGNNAFLSENVFYERFVDMDDPKFPLNGVFYASLDYTQMRGDRVNEMLAVSQSLTDRVSKAYDDVYIDNFTAILSHYAVQSRKVTVTLWVLQAPIFMLLAAFIFMVSRQMLAAEQNEIAVLKSRGAGKRQLVLIYLLQSALLSSAGFVLGVPLGMFICQALGSSNAFLEFVNRKSLALEIGPQAFLFALSAAALAIAVMVLPVFKYANVTIVAHKQSRGRRSGAAWWQKSFLDVILLGVSLYGLYTFNNQKAVLSQSVADGAQVDPLLYICSSLFMISSALVALRILPAIVWLVYRLFRRVWPPALYASFLRVLRTRSEQGFITVFLVVTIALGVFNAQAARTVNSGKEDNIRYLAGADIVLQEAWEDNQGAGRGGSGPPGAQAAADTEVIYYEPDFGKYEALLGRGVKSVTKVLWNNDVTMSVAGGTLKNILLMGIHTREFGETAWFNESLLPYHWYEYLNRMSTDSRAVLVSRNFLVQYGYKLGDALYYKNKNNKTARGVIYGFVDYWPSYAPVKYTRGSDGLYAESPQYLIVAHLQQLQAAWGLTPYQVWMKLDGSSQVVYDLAEQTETKYAKFTDAAAKMLKLKNDPVFQGTNGALTVGFIVVLILCTVGFLIYWILSIQSRALQFGIFRAMGMSLKEVIAMLVNEQVFVSGLAIAVGVAVGWLASVLFVPLIQIAYSSVDQAVPVTIVSARSDTIRLMAIVGVMIAICMGILASLIRHMKIAQALKLGED